MLVTVQTRVHLHAIPDNLCQTREVVDLVGYMFAPFGVQRYLVVDSLRPILVADDYAVLKAAEVLEVLQSRFLRFILGIM